MTRTRPKKLPAATYLEIKDLQKQGIEKAWFTDPETGERTTKVPVYVEHPSGRCRHYDPRVVG